MRRLVPLTFCCLLVWVGQAISSTAHDVTVGPNSTLSYSPASVTLAIGDSVHWSWSTGTHSVTANAGSFDSGVHSAGFTFDHTFNTVGSFAYHCSVHGLQMSGTVVVPGISGRAFDDLNGNGVADAGEPGLADATVDLSSSSTPVDSTVTDANGNYQFADHGSADYDITFTAPAGYTDTSPTNPIHIASYPGGTASTGHDFFAQSNRTIGGTVYNDVNGNGTADGGEVGMSNPVSVFLDSNNDGIRQSTEQEVQTAAGAYSLTHVPSGTQHVAIVVPAHFDATGPSTRTVQPGGPDSGVDFFVAAGNASIHGTLHDDPNGNGVADSGEGVLGGVTIGLDSTGDGVADRSIMTASDGTYSFGGLTAGSYKVLFSVPTGLEATGPIGYGEVLSHGQSKTGVDFFARTPPAVGGTGQQTPPEEPSPDQGPANIDLLGGTKGTNDNDALDGTSKADTILGLGGDDLILGFGGNDFLDGGPGDDAIDGGTGNDKLYGRAGNDILRGGPGNDRLVGGPGLDRLYGGPGNDVLIGGKGEDFYFGGAGNDVINAADGIAERIDCGTGTKDRATVDRKDHVKNCEKVTRR